MAGLVCVMAWFKVKIFWDSYCEIGVLMSKIKVIKSATFFYSECIKTLHLYIFHYARVYNIMMNCNNTTKFTVYPANDVEVWIYVSFLYIRRSRQYENFRLEKSMNHHFLENNNMDA